VLSGDETSEGQRQRSTSAERRRVDPTDAAESPRGDLCVVSSRRTSADDAFLVQPADPSTEVIRHLYFFGEDLRVRLRSATVWMWAARRKCPCTRLSNGRQRVPAADSSQRHG